MKPQGTERAGAPTTFAREVRVRRGLNISDLKSSFVPRPGLSVRGGATSAAVGKNCHCPLHGVFRYGGIFGEGCEIVDVSPDETGLGESCEVNAVESSEERVLKLDSLTQHIVHFVQVGAVIKGGGGH